MKGKVQKPGKPERNDRRTAARRGVADILGDRADRLIHERLRLGIVTSLAVNDIMSHNELKQALKTTDGNLSVHARKLEEANYIACTKLFDGRVPKTEYKLTAAGRRALAQYLDEMEQIIRLTREARAARK